jgi:hypothetical protein
MLIPLPNRPSRAIARTASVALVVVLAAAGCSSSDDTAASEEPTTTTEATTTTEDSTDATDSDESGAVSEVLLDGFIELEIPDGWEVTTEETPQLSADSPPETDLDTDALTQVLVVSPPDPRETATFSLIHYEHSDQVPDSELFSTAVADMFTSAGDEVGEPRELTIGGQSGFFYEVTSKSGSDGVFIVFQSGGEYFFVLSLVTDPDYADDAASLLGGIALDPEALSS